MFTGMKTELTSSELRYLKNYLKENFDFRGLKKAGVFSKEIKFNDYEQQAKRICSRLGLKSIYDFSLNKPIEFFYPFEQGIATGEFKNKFGEDVLNAIFPPKH
jgi:hypothetical protein